MTRFQQHAKAQRFYRKRAKSRGRQADKPRAASFTGVVFYKGPSVLDGAPIVGIATTESENGKTGPLIQTWILRRDVRPIVAINQGLDYSICGNCPLRGLLGSPHPGQRARNYSRGCYVNVGQAPESIYGKFKRGGYPDFHHREHDRSFRRGLRLGSYGDPTAIPKYAWAPLLARAVGNTPGYTHQWRQPRFQFWRRHLMASVASEAEYLEAKAMGWRCFRTRRPEQPILAGEIMCPASDEAGKRKQCISCGACNGSRSDKDQRADVVIIAHGGPSKLASALHVIQ